MARLLQMGSVEAAHSTGGEPSDRFALHCHDRYEVYYFVAGDVHYLVEGKCYRPAPHSVLLLRPGAFHGVRINDAGEAYERYTLHLPRDALPPESRHGLFGPFRPPDGGRADSYDIYYEHADRFHLGWYFESLLECARADPDVRELVTRIRMESLLAQILLMSRQVTGQVGEYENETVRGVIAYLNEHLTEVISLDLLSQRLYVGKYQLNALFRRHTGTTVYRYLIHKRVALAQQLILSGEPAARAAQQAGFCDYSAFYRSYKKVTGVSPSQGKAGRSQGAPL